MLNNVTLLIVDDDADVLTAARLLLRRHCQRVITLEDPNQIPAVLTDNAIDICLLDMNFAIGHNTGEEGLRWLGEIGRVSPDTVVILMTAYGDLNVAVRAMREGAADFVLKPWQNEKLIATLNLAAELHKSRARIAALSESTTNTDMIAGSPAMQQVMERVARIATTDATVLVRGENGTGKELIARELHRLSARSKAALISVDLGAVPETLFESELFGHKRGAFTGADRDRAGRFQAASGGTLFLDEIGNLPIPLQVKLLRALETKEVSPLGSDTPVNVDIRLIAATNQPLEQMVADGTFREDLFYRINTITLELPPLRERLEDLRELACFFANQAARRHKLPPRAFTPSALRAMAQWQWPGNIRELAHTIERAVILCDGEEIDDIDLALTPVQVTKNTDSLNLEENERHLVKTALSRYSGNVSHASEALGVTRAALYRRMEKFGL